MVRRDKPAPAANAWLWLAGLCLAALAARLYTLSGPALRWDEGWSLAHASLPWSQLADIALADRHPPLYFAMLKLWLVTGKSTWGLRFFSVLPGVLAVPMMYLVAGTWAHGAASLCADRARSRLPLLAAGFGALWPLLVYYGQVARMYSWSALWVLAAAYFALSALQPSEVGTGAQSTASGERRRVLLEVGLVLSSAAALYTLYHTAWVLAGLWLYAAIARPQRFGRLVTLGVLTLVLFAPWLVKALATIGQRLSEPAAGAHTIGDWARLMWASVEGLAFVQGSGRVALVALCGVLALGLVVRKPTRSDVRHLLLPAFVLAFSIVGVAVGSQQLWFAPRHLVPATPFLGLLLAWALDRLAARWWPLCLVALAVLAAVYGPAATGFVYDKSLEVTDPFDAAADYRYLAAHAGPDDLVFFNALAKAGWYESLRTPQDPRWEHALRWEPVVEPMSDIRQRVLAAARTHERLWFVLYQGEYGPNAELTSWLNATFFPAHTEWQGDTLYMAYVAGEGDAPVRTVSAAFEQGVRLSAAAWSSTVRPGGALAVTLVWEARGPLEPGRTVFVHLVDSQGRLVAQHDGVPAAGRAPTEHWSSQGLVQDRHGVLVPSMVSGPLELRVGLYNPDDGSRLALLDGGDAVSLGLVEVLP